MEQVPEDQGQVLHTSGTPVGPNVPILKNQSLHTRWRLISVVAKLTADANVADRYVYLDIYKASIIYMRFMCQTPQTNGQVVLYTWSSGSGSNLIAGSAVGVVSIGTNILMSNEMVVKVDCVNRQTTDQFSDLDLLVEEWIEPLS